MFILKYHGGKWDDSYHQEIFVTNNEKVAKDYVKKFNTIITNYNNFYKKFEEEYFGHYKIKEEYIQYYDRYNWLKNITKAYYEKIDYR